MRAKRTNKKKVDLFNVILNLLLILLAACFVIPLLLIVSASFTSEEYLKSGGAITLFPREFSVMAYRMAFANVERMVRAYVVTFSQAAIGTLLAGIIAGMVAYPLSRTNFRFRKPITGFIFFTMLFNAGMIPTYLVYSQMYHITNTFWVYILPGITGGAWNTLVYRTFFKGIPESLFESAHLDGARELTIFYKIVVPLSKPVFASLGFMTLVQKWNSYTTSMIYIRNENLYTLQYLLQRIIEESEFLNSLKSGALDIGISIDTSNLPGESMRFALCIIAAGPMLVVFPFFQKYFSKGLTIGAVKG